MKEIYNYDRIVLNTKLRGYYTTLSGERINAKKLEGKVGAVVHTPINWGHGVSDSDDKYYWVNFNLPDCFNVPHSELGFVNIKCNLKDMKLKKKKE
jgi:hypothetical protein